MSNPVRLSVSVELLSGSYDAAEMGDVQAAEWPPHPARLFCALVAAARGEAERSALAWLEAQQPPLVFAAEIARTQTRTAYVVTNAVDARGGSQAHPGRTNGMRQRSAAVPPLPRVRFVWEDAAPPAGAAEALDRMARRIPYLGRSTGIALVSASADARVSPDTVEAGGAVFEPCDLARAEVSLRVPYPGFLAALDSLFEAGEPGWQAARYLGYRVRRPAVTADAEAPSVYSDVVVFQFAGLRPEGRLAALFTQALRSAVLRGAGDGAPAVLHGHGADGRPHVAFLALPNVGAEHADGHLLGLAVAVPDLPAEQRRAIVAAALSLRRPGEQSACDLPVRGIGTVELAYKPGLVRPWAVQPERWREGSARWVSATPVVLDRYPKDGDIVAEVRRACWTVGLPDPAEVRVGREPLLAGGVRMRTDDLPEKLRGRLFRHVALTFECPVAGPVLLGAGRYLGVGLLAPVKPPKAVHSGPSNADAVAEAGRVG